MLYKPEGTQICSDAMQVYVRATFVYRAHDLEECKTAAPNVSKVNRQLIGSEDILFGFLEIVFV